MSASTRSGRLWPAVFGRSFIASIGGGAVVSALTAFLVVVPVSILVDDYEAPFGSVMLFMALLGAAVGVVLGVVAGGLLALFAQSSLLPYQGRDTTVSRFRATAMLTVGAPFIVIGVFFLRDHPERLIVLVPIAVLALVGTRLVAPWVVGGFVKRCEQQSLESEKTGPST